VRNTKEFADTGGQQMRSTFAVGTDAPLAPIEGAAVLAPHGHHEHHEHHHAASVVLASALAVGSLGEVALSHHHDPAPASVVTCATSTPAFGAYGPATAAGEVTDGPALDPGCG
jgi:hypothetical protein